MSSHKLLLVRKMFPDALLERLPPNQLAQVCTTFRNWIYQRYNGPFFNLSWIQFDYGNYNSLAWSKVQFVVTKIDEELKKSNKEFLLKVWKAHPEFLRVCWQLRWCYWIHDRKNSEKWPERSDVIQDLVEQGNLETCTWILENMDFPQLDPEISYHGIFQEPIPYPYFRQIIFHNIRLGLGLERSWDTGRARRPVYHRGRTMLKIVQNDDVELMKLYLDQRISDRINSNLPPQPYQHYDYWVFVSYLYCCIGAVQIWKERGLHQLSQERKKELICLGTSETLQFAIEQGCNFNEFLFFRMAIKKNPRLAEVLLRNYKLDWFEGLRAQDKKHLLGRIHNAKLTKLFEKSV